MYFNIYDFVSEKANDRKRAELNLARLRDKYALQLLNDLSSMIEYDNIPNGLDTSFLEVIRLTNGHCGVVKDGDNFVAIQGSFSGVPNYYGIGSNYVGVTLGGQLSVDNKVNEDIAIFKNNKLYTPDIFNILDFAEMFAQTWISKRLNVIYSRALPMFKVNNNHDKEALKVAIKDLFNGVPSVMQLGNIEELIEGAKSIERVDISDVKDNDMLQYIARFDDDLLKAFYTYYGHAMNGNSKLAQVSVDEVNNNDSVASIYPHNRLNEARKGCEILNKIYGTNMTARFSEAWEVRHNDLIKDVDLNSTEENKNEEVSENDNKIIE